MAYINGINLGGWLVLEKWITPSLFEGLSVSDEYGLCKQGDSTAIKRLAKHRRTFITLKDFRWLQRQGITAVRIPVGYWIFGDQKPYIGTIKQLDQAFEWAKKTDIRILICLHGAPGSQNGEMHSGRQGNVGWHIDPHNIVQTLDIIRKLVVHYKQSPQFWGIELLNEPSSVIPKRLLKQYYRRAYHSVRKECGPQIKVVINDIYKPQRWNWVLHWPFYRNVYLDTHQYQLFTAADRAMDLVDHIAHTETRVAKQLKRLCRHHRVIVGEWSAALDARSLTGRHGQQAIDVAHQTYYRSQAKVYGRTDGDFYWTYKTEDDGPWNYKANHVTYFTD